MATITIKTVHGYVSFQPNGQIAYSSEAGPWETFTIGGLTIPPCTSPPPSQSGGGGGAGTAGTGGTAATDAIDLSRAQIASGDCPDVRQWSIIAPLQLVEFAATEKFERGDTMVDFPGRDALPAAIGTQGPIAYTLWMGCRIGGTWFIAPIVECIRAYVPTGPILARDQVKTNFFYYTDPPLCTYQPAPGEQVAFFCTTGDTRRQNAQAVPTPARTTVVVVPFAVGRYVR